MRAFIDLTGQTFNRLYVVKRVENKVLKSHKKVEKIQYLCKCECGNECVVIGEDLKSGHTKSCGCLYQQRGKYPIQYELVDENCVKGYNCRGESFLIDKEDYERICKYRWSKGEKHRYWRNQSLGSMSRFIMCLTDKNYVVDHINGDTNDNGKCNLRICTQRQNSMNRHYDKVMGVWEENGKWKARIKTRQKLLQLGIFDTEEEAIKARKDAEKKYFGEFAPR